MKIIKLLVTGASSQVGSALCTRAVNAGMTVVGFDDNLLNSMQLESIQAVISSSKPDYVVNTASYSVVD
jgi:dTDP-4-dehydrorhamnose reductase